MIDDFVAPPLGHGISDLSGTVFGTSTASDASILGTRRTLGLNYISGGGFADLQANNSAVGGVGALVFAATSHWSGIATVKWDGPAGDLGLDMSATPIVELDFISVDITGVNVYVTVSDGANTVSTAASSISGAGKVEQFDLSALAVDLTSIDYIEMIAQTSNPGTDWILKDAILVPEPHEYALLAGLGLLGLAAYRRIKA